MKQNISFNANMHCPIIARSNESSIFSQSTSILVLSYLLLASLLLLPLSYSL